MLEALASSRSKRVVEALEELDEADARLPVEQAHSLLKHRSARIRRRTIALLAKQREQGLTRIVADYLRDRDAEVRLEAARYLYRTLEGEHLPLLKQGLEHDDLRIRAAAVGVVAESGSREEKALITNEVLESLLRYDGPGSVDTRVEAVRALGSLGRPELYERHRRLLDDPAPQVVRAAIQAAGTSGNRLFVGKLMRLLGEPAYEKVARRALRAFGERIFGTLYDYLADDTTPEPVRRNIPRILTGLPTQSAVDLMLLSLGQLRAPLLYDVAKALNKLRESSPHLRFSKDPIDAAVLGEIRALATVQATLFHHGRSPDRYANAPGAGEVEQALYREREQSLERVFRLLGLRYPSADMHSAYLGLTENPDLRASAAEFLDSLLDWEFKRYLVPLLDDAPDMGDVRVAQEMAGRTFPTWQSSLHYLLLRRHPRPLACDLAAVPDALPPFLAEIALAACTPDPSDDPPEMKKADPPAFRPSDTGEDVKVQRAKAQAGGASPRPQETAPRSSR